VEDFEKGAFERLLQAVHNSKPWNAEGMGSNDVSDG
jgi:hypothetical protein